MATQVATKPKKKKAPARRRPSASTSRKKARRGTGTALPAWGDLGPVEKGRIAKQATRAKAGAKKAKKKAKAKAQKLRPLDAVPSLRFGLLTLLACVALTLYVGHVYATQAVLSDLQDARRENERLRLTNQRLQGDRDRMTGPSAVMPAAARLGLEEGIAYGPPIHLDSK
ncbi:MAG: hypothetical protein AAF845_13520 [Bacteroidota bacterium]